ncbi:reverse transcriptase domain-containing protein [Tanacetum coccineum]
MSHRSSSHADVSTNKSRRTLNYSSYPYPAKHLEVDSSIDSESELEVSGRIMAGRSTRSNTANNTNPPNETADEVTRQLNTALPNLLTQLVQALGGNRTNQREVTQSCSIKTFRASGAKEFFDTEGAVGLLTWFESIESVLHITKCPSESQVEFTSSMLLKQNSGIIRWLGQILMGIQLDFMSWQGWCHTWLPQRTSVSIATFGVWLPRSNLNRTTTTGGNRPNPMLAIEGNPNPGNNQNRAQGRAFALGVAKVPQDPNVVTGTFSLNDHFATVLFDSGADYSFISTNFLPLINMKPGVISLGYDIKISSGLKVVTNMIVRGCKLELEGHTFIIDLIPFGHGSFDVIVGKDWLSKLRAKIVCYEKIVQIPFGSSWRTSRREPETVEDHESE